MITSAAFEPEVRNRACREIVRTSGSRHYWRLRRHIENLKPRLEAIEGFTRLVARVHRRVRGSASLGVTGLQNRLRILQSGEGD